MRLTPLAKGFIAAVVCAVIGFATWHYKGDAIKKWAGGEKTAGEDAKGDFDKLNNAPGDPARNVGSTGVGSASVGTGRLNRPLVVGINTWAGQGRWTVSHGGIMNSRGRDSTGKPTSGEIVSHAFRAANGTGVFMAVPWSKDAQESLDDLRHAVGETHKFVKIGK